MLLVAAPGSASAVATGQFNYKYTDENGHVVAVQLVNPATGICKDVAEVTSGVAKFAFAPYNHTDTVLWAYTEKNCGGKKRLGKSTSSAGRLIH
ncbi:MULTISPECIES: hypothetical protein [unclassified Streptomyces]|uniref:hypothetical protein n=1 Tax=unclassified Streptomyces TaxID=2593676 RepID=UPI00380B643C